MKVRIFDNADAASLYAAGLIEQVVDQPMDKANPVLGLATGSSVIGLYRHLVRFTEQGLDWSHVTTINLDEYIGLERDHPQSYFSFMHKHLLNFVNTPADRIYIPNGAASDPESECEWYDQVLKRNPIDIQVLGIGVNGHIGFNEPNDLLESRTHVVQLSEQTIESNSRFFEDGETVPNQAITMGVQAILRAREIVLLAFGEQKAHAIANSFNGTVRTEFPASILQLHPRLTLVLDRDCAVGLNVERLTS